MKILFLATANSFKYEFDDKSVNGVDVSSLSPGEKLSISPEIRKKGIRSAYCDDEGVLHLVLQQCVIASQYPGRRAHWRESMQEIEADDYNPEVCYVTPTGVADLKEGRDYEITQGTDVAGNKGWTIKKIEEAE